MSTEFTIYVCANCHEKFAAGQHHDCKPLTEERVRGICREVHDEHVKRLVSEVENVRLARDDALASAIEAIQALRKGGSHA